MNALFDSAAYNLTLGKINPLLREIPDDDDKKLVDEFWRKAARYFGTIYGIDKAIENGQTKKEDACGPGIEKTYEILHEGEQLNKSLKDGGLIKKIKMLFRECGIPVGIKSEIVKHAFLKPSGYAGDFGIIEIVYDNKIISNGVGYCADKLFLMDDYARAVRSRKEKMKEILAAFLNSAPSRSIEILNIACGSCRELKEMFHENAFDESKKISFTLVDHDQAALDFSREALKKSPPHVEYHFMRHNAYEFVKNPDAFRDILSGKDLVYTIGLADYIPDQPLTSLIAFFYSILNPGGKLIIAHKDSKNFSPLAADWWCDWTFHLRNESETVSLVDSAGIKNCTIDVIRESETNIIFFMIVEKKI
ncbi:MAG: hypothetical protein A2176_00405 [Spirochaetes bacterium RBG_13_51_14]|nr:MAG: hypothetical protein A2176_00405 [Spirochaetes bacterium RBG_13_51_14]